MDFKDYYAVLGVPKSASAEAIKAAYRQQARKYHPDVNPGNAAAEERFKALNEAYEVLSSPDHRARYDQLGANWREVAAQQEAQRRWREQQARARQSPADDEQEGAGFDDVFGGGFSEFFRTFFGGERPSPRGGGGARTSSADLRATAQFTLEDAFRGGPQRLTVGGQELRLTLKPGFRDGQRLKIKGRGAAGPNGRGDLYLSLRVAPHSRFERVGDDLKTTAPVDLYTLLLGGELSIDTLSGPVKVTLPPDTAPDAQLRLRGKGMPVYGQPGQAGALLVSLRLELPRQLSARERELVEQLRRLRPR